MKSNRGAPEEEKKEQFMRTGLVLLFKTPDNGAGQEETNKKYTEKMRENYEGSFARGNCLGKECG